MVFRITWLPTSAAPQLRYLVDNDQPIPMETCEAIHHGIEVRYSRPTAPAHLIAWGLECVGIEMKNLRAQASLEGGTFKEIGSSVSSFHFWKGKEWL